MPDDQQSNHIHTFCEGIIAKDSAIRFAGLANQMGKLLGAAYRQGLQPLMNSQETEHYTIQTVLRASTRETFENKIGKQLYAIAVYEKLIRATIPIPIVIDDEAKNNGDNDDKKEKRRKDQDPKWLYLLVSFDSGSDVISIVENKILPQIKQSGKDSLVA
ncbi:MAG TPA: hypothetical protein VGE97_05575 [Nitrososphaera sp.]